MVSSFKKDKSKIRVINDIYMLLMVEKGIREVMCNTIHCKT